MEKTNPILRPASSKKNFSASKRETIPAAAAAMSGRKNHFENSVSKGIKFLIRRNPSAITTTSETNHPKIYAASPNFGTRRKINAMQIPDEISELRKINI